jgi:hypothetical protein
MHEINIIGLFFIVILLIFTLFVYKHKDGYKNIQGNNVNNYPLWMHNNVKVKGKFEDEVKIEVKANSNISQLAKTDSHQNISEDYLQNPNTFCAQRSNAWKRPCPNYWLFPEMRL